MRAAYCFRVRLFLGAKWWNALSARRTGSRKRPYRLQRNLLSTSSLMAWWFDGDLSAPFSQKMPRNHVDIGYRRRQTDPTGKPFLMDAF